MTAPPIVARSAWGANPLNTPAGHIATPAPELWLHHTASTGLHGSSGMRSLQANALAGGYVDLEYTYIVDTDGTIFESRGPGRNTAATGGHNDISHAICCMGNFESQVPTEAMLDAVAAVTRWMASSGYSPATITGPHRDASGNSTACCGKNLIARIDDINARALFPTPTPPEPGDDDMPQCSTAVNADGRPELFSLDKNGVITHRWRNATGGAWSDWQPLGDGPYDSVSAYANPDGRLEVIAHKPAGGYQHCWQTKPNGAWSTWNEL